MQTTPEAAAFIKETKAKIFDDQGVINHIGYLKDRWKDEKEFEDFNDYKKNIKGVTFPDVRVSKAFTITRSAFGAKVTVKFGARGNVTYSASAPKVEFRG